MIMNMNFDFKYIIYIIYFMDQTLNTIFDITIIIILVLFSGLFSGLTLGLLSLDSSDLQVLIDPIWFFDVY